MKQIDGIKYCSKCKKQYPIKFFHKCKYQPDGLHNQCKNCCRKYSKIYREKNIDKIRRMNKLNLPKRREREKKKKQKNHEYYQRFLQYQKDYRLKNKEILNKKQRDSWNRKREQRRKQKREHYKQNTIQILKRNKYYRITENGKRATARHHDNRRRLGNIELIPNLLDNIEKPIHHHITDEIYVWIPEDLHQSFLFGYNKQKHRDYLEPIIEQLYELKM